MYVRKSERASNAVNSARFAKALQVANIAYAPKSYVETKDGRRIRVWEEGDYGTDDDVRAWLLGNRVVELEDGPEFVRESYVRTMVKTGMLKKDPVGSFYWVTTKAAERYRLPPVMGKPFPKP